MGQYGRPNLALAGILVVYLLIFPSGDVREFSQLFAYTSWIIYFFLA